MSGTPFDPRRLADLANRVGPPAAYAAPQPVAAEPATESGATESGAAGIPTAAGTPTAAEAPTEVGDRPGGGTGHARVDAALGELARAASLAPHEQIAAYESVHRTLQETLRSIEQT